MKLELIKLTEKSGRVDSFAKIELDGHEYIVNTYSWKIMVHNEACPCKVKDE